MEKKHSKLFFLHCDGRDIYHLPFVYISLGFSLSILNVDDATLSRLDHPTRAPAWPVGVDGTFLWFSEVYYGMFIVCFNFICFTRTSTTDNNPC